MKRTALILTVLGILCVAAGQAQAHHSYHHGGYYGPVMVHPPVWAGPRVIVTAPPPPPVVYPPMDYRPVYRYRSYDPGPRSGFYYQGRGMSLGIGW